jgi:hypothetical protein
MRRIGELGIKLAVTSNRRTLRRSTLCISSCHPLDGGIKFLRNVCYYESHTVKHPRRLHSAQYILLPVVSMKIRDSGLEVKYDKYLKIF